VHDECPICDLNIRQDIEAVFLRERRWMGFYLVRHQANLGWCPMATYVRVFNEMRNMGKILVCFGEGDQFPLYLLSRLTFPYIRSEHQ